jgi:hypothetical protein
MLHSKLNTQHPQNSIDFFSELSKIIQNTSSESLTKANTNTNTSESSEPSESSNVIICPSTSPSSDDNICLISKDKLHPNHITLKCNHKFNYIPIYKEVLYQKTKSNPIYEVTKLQSYQIKCPYCRTITNKLLPFIQYPTVKLAKNIHSTGSDCLPTAKCSHIIKKRHANNGNGDTKCDKNALYYEAENLLFCPTHYKKYIAKNPTGSTGSTSSIAIESTKPRCVAILKSGVNVGKPCNSFISIDGSQFCKRHSH